MRADDHVDRAGRDVGDDGLLLLRREEAAQDLHPHRVAGEALTERLAVLVREQRRRREDRDLLAVLHRLEGRPHRDLGLAVADVAADQPVHRDGLLHVALHLGDRLELVGRLLVRERVLHLPLPRRVGTECEPDRSLALAVEDHELRRDLLHRTADPVARLLPVGAAHLAERRRVPTRVAADRADLVGRDVELVATAVRDEQVVTLDPTDRPGDHPLVAPDPVHLVHDEVVGLQVLVVVDGLSRLARPSVDAPAAGEIGLGDQGQPCVGEHHAALERRDDERQAAGLERGCLGEARVHPLAREHVLQP